MADQVAYHAHAELTTHLFCLHKNGTTSDEERRSAEMRQRFPNYRVIERWPDPGPRLGSRDSLWVPSEPAYQPALDGDPYETPLERQLINASGANTSGYFLRCPCQCETTIDIATAATQRQHPEHESWVVCPDPRACAFVVPRYNKVIDAAYPPFGWPHPPLPENLAAEAWNVVRRRHADWWAAQKRLSEERAAVQSPRPVVPAAESRSPEVAPPKPMAAPNLRNSLLRRLLGF